MIFTAWEKGKAYITNLTFMPKTMQFEFVCLLVCPLAGEQRIKTQNEK